MPAVFDGVDDSLECAIESSFDWERTSPMSMAAWIKLPANVSEAFLGKAQLGPPQRGIALNTESSSGPTIMFHLISVAGAGDTLTVFCVDNLFQPFFWVHVCVTYDGSVTAAGVTFYRNGVETSGAKSNVDVATLTGTILTDNPFRIAGHETGGGEFWNGAIAGVVADNVEWTAAEVANLAKIGNFLKPPSELLSAAPELWLPIGSGPSSSIFDITDYANAHHAAILGAPTAEPNPAVILDWKADGFGVTSTSFTSTTSFTHAPDVSSLQGVVVLIAQNVSSADLITSVTYGGKTMQRVRIAQDAAGEPGAVYAYFLGTGVPAGSQTVDITVASGTDAKQAYTFGLLASGDLRLVTSGIVQGDVANPSVTLATPADFNGMAFSILFSGAVAPTSLTAGAGYTAPSGRDFGAQSARSELANKSGANIACGWTAASDDVAMVGLAIDLAPPSFEYPRTSRRPMPMMRGPDRDRRTRMGS